MYIKGPISLEKLATKNENNADTIMQSFSSKYRIKKYSFLKGEAMKDNLDVRILNYHILPFLQKDLENIRNIIPH